MFLQGSIFGTAPLDFDASFGRVERLDLDRHSWVDHVPDWIAGADELFDGLVDSVPWVQRHAIPMYDNLVTEPRLTFWADTPHHDALPTVVADIADALSDRYRANLRHVSANLYRDGADSVTWHRDRNRFAEHNPLVAIVSLGARRPFKLRPYRRTAGSAVARSLSWNVGQGDLMVMGGACQHEWEHAVPKLARPTGPRIALMFRSVAISPSAARNLKTSAVGATGPRPTLNTTRSLRSKVERQ